MRKNNHGFTLIELLATILVLALIMGLAIPSIMGVISNAKKESYKTTVKNIESTAIVYLKENSDKISFIPTSQSEYQCIKVKHLIDSGYFDNDILDSKVNDLENVNEDMYIYVSRNLENKTINESKLILDTNLENYCDSINGTLNKRIDFQYDRGWEKVKDVKITYTLSNVTDIDQIDDYVYSHKINSDNKVEATFDKRVITKTITVTKPSTITAMIDYIKESDPYFKTINITKVDSDAPYIKNLPGDTRYQKGKNITVTIEDVSGGSGFEPGNSTLSVKYGWSKSSTTEPTTYNNGTLTYSNCNSVDTECQMATFQAVGSDMTGDYYLWVIPNMHDIAGNDVAQAVSTGTYKFDNEKPIVNISAKDYNTFDYSESHDNVSIAGYYVNTTGSNPTISSNWENGTTYDIASAETYYVWAIDEAGNISDKSSITSYKITKNEGVGTKIKVLHENSSGSEITDPIYVLSNTVVYISATTEMGYNTLSLTFDGDAITSGTIKTITSNSNIVSSAKSNVVTININKNNSLWNSSGVGVALYKGSTKVTNTSIASTSSVTFNNVENGTYNVYASNISSDLVDTGIDVTVSNNAITSTINYYTLTILKTTGVNNVLGAGTYIKNQTVNISSELLSGYSFNKWTTTGDTPTSSTSASTTIIITKETTLTPEVKKQIYTINYYLGNGTSIVGSTKISSSSCNLNTNCTLVTFASLGATFPYANTRWSFAGWSTSETSPSVTYVNGATINRASTATLNLYAVGSRTFDFYSGVAPTSATPTNSLTQYWIPYGTSTTYSTSITIPQPKSIDTWTALGYRGNDKAEASVSLAANEVKNPIPTGYEPNPYRAKYSRDLKILYNGNGNTGGTTNGATFTQYYSSGYGTGSANSGAKVSTITFALAENGFTKTNYTFNKWADDSTSGTQYASGVNYTWAPVVNSAATTKKMYAIWNANSITITNISISGYVNGDAIVGNTLTATVSANPTSTYSYQWYYTSASYTFNSSKSGVAITGCTTSTCTVPEVARGKYMYVEVTASKDNYMSATATSATTPAVKKTYVYTVTFNAQGLSISHNDILSADTIQVSCTDTTTATSGSCSITSPTIAKKDGFEIIGWGTSSSATTAAVASGGKITLTSNKTYYALVKQLDKTGPVITFSPNGNTTYAKSQSTKVTVTDDSGVSTIKYKWSTSSTASATAGTSTSSGATLTKSTGTGKYYLCVYAVDSAGNSTNTCSKAFYLDNTAPICSKVIASTTSADGQPKGCDLEITASDSHSGLASKAYYFSDEGDWQTDSEEWYSTAIKNLVTKVRDKAGNETTCATLNLTTFYKYRYRAVNPVCCTDSECNVSPGIYKTSGYIYSTSEKALTACESVCSPNEFGGNAGTRGCFSDQSSTKGVKIDSCTPVGETKCYNS